MSYLDSSVYGGTLLCHVVAGEELAHADIAHAAMTANMSEDMLAGDHYLRELCKHIPASNAAKVAKEPRSFWPADTIDDYLVSKYSSSIGK